MDNIWSQLGNKWNTALMCLEMHSFIGEASSTIHLYRIIRLKNNNIFAYKNIYILIIQFYTAINFITQTVYVSLDFISNITEINDG